MAQACKIMQASISFALAATADTFFIKRDISELCTELYDVKQQLLSRDIESGNAGNSRRFTSSRVRLRYRAIGAPLNYTNSFCVNLIL